MLHRLKTAASLLLVLVTFGFDAAGQPTKLSPALDTAIRLAGEGETLKAWVFFVDKGPNPEARLATIENNLPARARTRRLRHRPERLVDRHDLPVYRPYVSRVAARVIRVRHESRWLNAVSVEVGAEAIRPMAALPFVRRLDIVRSTRAPLPEPVPVPLRAAPGPSMPSRLNYGSSFGQVDMINVPALHDLGYSGHGVLVCMLDSGFNNLEHQALDHLDILETRDFVNGDSIVWDQEGQMGSGSHGTYTLSALAGFAPGELIGPAWGATFMLGKTENTEWERHIEEDDWVAGAEWADSAGADVISSSLGYRDGFTHGEPNYTWSDLDGNTTIVTIAADIAAGRGILVVNSAGNGGAAIPPSNTLVAPADGDSVLGIGAVDTGGVRASFSSMGPTADGRFKPDVMAQGVSVYAASPTSVTGYLSVGGTSLSCPLVAGAAALVLEANPTMTNMEIIDALRSTASNSGNPDNEMGWGIIDAYAAAFTSSGVENGRFPPDVVMYPAAPNPFNPTTRLRYLLPEPGLVRLTIYDVRGREIITLVNEHQDKGLKSVIWDGTSTSGRRVGSGLYICRLSAGQSTRSQKVLLLK